MERTLEISKKKRRFSFAKLRKFTDVCLVRSKFVPPSPLHKNVCDFEELVLIFYESTSNMTIVLIFLSCSVQWSRRIFPKLSMLEVEKKKRWKGL